MRTHLSTSAVAAALTLGLAIAACDGLEPSVPAAIRLEPQSLELPWGRHTAVVTATLLDQRGAVVDDWPAGFSPGWSIADTTVAVAEVMLRTAIVRAARGGQTALTAAPAGISPTSVPVTVLPAPDTISGEIHFVYEGDHTGSYAVGGAWPFDHGDPGYLHTLEYLRDQGAWGGAGTHHRSPGLFFSRVRPDGRDDALFIWVDGPSVGPGTYSLRQVDLNLGWDRAGAVIQTEATYEATGDGGLTVTEVTEARVRGTFSLLMRMRFPSGDIYYIQVDGSFDAPVVAAQS
jgi:hypothetical protein